MGNSCTSVFPNTRAWEQQERNKTKIHTKKVRREACVWKEKNRARKKDVPLAHHYPTRRSHDYVSLRCGKITIKLNYQKMDLHNLKMKNHLTLQSIKSQTAVFLYQRGTQSCYLI